MNEKILCANTQIVDVDSLVPNPKNPNKHPEKQIAQLAKIIKHQGQRLPIVVSKRSGFIVAGHGRLDAIKSLGWLKCAVDEQEFASEADEYAHMIADNKIAELAEHDDSLMIQQLKDMDFNLDLDLLGMDDFKLPEICEPQCDEDEIPEQVDTRCKRGDVWLLGNHRLMCGDSTMIDDVEKLMNGEKADMVFTDPPYGGKVVGKAGGKDTGFNKAINKLKKSIEFISNFNPSELLQILNIIGATSQYIFTNLTLLKEYLNDNSKVLVWHKKHGLPSVGNYNSDIEFIVFNKKEGSYFDNGNKDLSYSRLITMTKSDNDLHPTMKPIALIENCIRISSKEKNIIVDLFGGSGSTLIACEKTGRKCYMMELDPHYCDVILARWEKYTGKKAERANG